MWLEISDIPAVRHCSLPFLHPPLRVFYFLLRPLTCFLSLILLHLSGHLRSTEPHKPSSCASCFNTAKERANIEYRPAKQVRHKGARQKMLCLTLTLIKGNTAKQSQANLKSQVAAQTGSNHY